MNPIQIPFLVEGILILISSAFGFLLGKTGKPYSKWKLGLHLFFSLWFVFGFVFIAIGQFTPNGMAPTLIPVVIMALAILAQVISGIGMTLKKTVKSPLRKVHYLSALVLLMADLVAYFLAG